MVHKVLVAWVVKGTGGFISEGLLGSSQRCLAFTQGRGCLRVGLDDGGSRGLCAWSWVWVLVHVKALVRVRDERDMGWQACLS